MVDIYGDDFTHDDKEVWTRAKKADGKSRVYGIGASDIDFMVNGTLSSSSGIMPSYADYQQSQEKVQNLESLVEDLNYQLGGERKSREELEQRLKQNEQAQQEVQQQVKELMKNIRASH